MNRWSGILSAVGCALALSGCAHVQASPKAAVDTPPLDVPAPPPRVIEVAAVESPPPPMTLPEEPQRNPVLRARPPARPDPPRPETGSRVEPPRPEPPPAEPPKPADEPGKAVTTLQTTPPTAEGEVERAIRAILARATNDLGRIDYRGLNADARTQYDTAKRFVRQAEEALRLKNPVFARNLADKAGALAAQLAGR